MTCQDVALHLGLSWDTVRDIEKRRLKRDFAKPPLKNVTHIAIDEIAIKNCCRSCGNRTMKWTHLDVSSNGLRMQNGRKYLK
jgi:hypothetical protein